MAIEIERKFLVTDTAFLAGTAGEHMAQGYLTRGRGPSVRVRLSKGRALLTIKSGGEGILRDEFEYPIPHADARAMFDHLCAGATLEKTRYRVQHGSHVWDIDVFHGANEGLVVAEVELSSEDEEFEQPPWIGAEVSDDPRYLNARLVLEPWSTWTDR